MSEEQGAEPLTIRIRDQGSGMWNVEKPVLPNDLECYDLHGSMLFSIVKASLSTKAALHLRISPAFEYIAFSRRT